jgi:aspartyl-tRNA(Asn)/glutamyl-tRNA(Gln) amidotransferase subunit A
MNIEQAAAKLRAREVSAVELARESLRRIRELQPVLNAFITVTEELALKQARSVDEELARGIDRGPLHGIPYTLKDLFATRGIRTTAGSKIFADYVPDYDCAAFEKLTEAGAVLMGKTGMHELAYGITNDNPHFGAVRNPHDPARISGGSSGGSAAAVAAEMVFFALGTDTGGSIRIPAAYCGCVGLKPTFGRVSRYGVVPLAFSLDHVGPLARTVRDTALVMNSIAGFDQRDDSSSRRSVPDYLPTEGHSLAGRRIGIPDNFFRESLAPPVEAAYKSVLDRAENLGALLVPIKLPDPAGINSIGRMILLSEASALMQPYLHRRSNFGADVLALLDQGRLVSATEYINAQRLRRVYQKRWAEYFKDVDVIVTPTTAIHAPLIGQEKVQLGEVDEDVRLASTRFVRPFNVLGLPAMSVPSFDSDVPRGFQLIGPPFAEISLFSVASMLLVPGE